MCGVNKAKSGARGARRGPRDSPKDPPAPPRTAQSSVLRTPSGSAPRQAVHAASIAAVGGARRMGNPIPIANRTSGTRHRFWVCSRTASMTSFCAPNEYLSAEAQDYGYFLPTYLCKVYETDTQNRRLPTYTHRNLNAISTKPIIENKAWRPRKLHKNYLLTASWSYLAELRRSDLPLIQTSLASVWRVVCWPRFCASSLLCTKVT